MQTSGVATSSLVREPEDPLRSFTEKRLPGRVYVKSIERKLELSPEAEMRIKELSRSFEENLRNNSSNAASQEGLDSISRAHVDKAYASTSSFRPSKKRYFGAIGGLFAGAIISFFLERFADNKSMIGIEGIVLLIILIIAWSLFILDIGRNSH